MWATRSTRNWRPSCGTGVNFSKQKLLRLGIILFGLRLTFQDIGQVGLTGVAIDTTVLCSTFALAWVLGTKVLDWIATPRC